MLVFCLRKRPKIHTRTSEFKGNNLSFLEVTETLVALTDFHSSHAFLGLASSAVFCFLVLKDNQRNTQKTIGYPFEFIYCIHIKYQVNGDFQKF